MNSRKSVSRLGLPIAVLVLVAAQTPAIAQRVPGFVFPAVATLGGVLIVVSSVRAFRRRALVPLVANLVALVFFIVMPATHLVRALTAPPSGTARIHAGFGDWLGAEGYPRFSAHRGLDIAARPGAEVLAAADGRVTVARDNRDLCGLIVVIDHDPHGLRTVYCHFSAIGVRVGDTVRRGQPIGAAGISGQRAWPGFEHVHLEVQRGRDVNALEDPLARMAGCFDGAKAYPTDRLVLTYPVRC